MMDSFFSYGFAVIFACAAWAGPLSAQVDHNAGNRQPTASHSAAKNYYVDAVRGSDGNNGLSVSSPFRTLGRARDQVRSLDKRVKGDIVINLRQGTYFQKTTLSFTEEDGGTDSCSVIYRAFPGESPIVSGGQRIIGWTLYDKARNIYRAATGNLHFRQLYINGRWGIRARTPDTAMYRDIQWDTASRRIRVPKKILPPSSDCGGMELVTVNAFTGNHLLVKGVATDSLYAYMSVPENQELIFRVAAFAFQGKEYFFENSYSFLDEGGEWWLDRKEGWVYYKPKAGQDMQHAEVIAPVLDPIVRIEGTDLDHTTGNIRFKGISFMHSTWLRPDTSGLIEMQANQYFMPDSGPKELTGRPSAAVIVRNAHQIVFDRCIFANTGATALDFVSGTRDDLVIGNVFRDIAGNALSFGLTAKENESNMNVYRPADIRELPDSEIVSNNYITDVGKDYTAGVGFFYAYARNMRITANEIAHVPYTGISGGWGWNSTQTAMANNQITNNYIHDYMRLYYDGGGIYTLSNQPNSLCAGNYIENMQQGPRGYGWNGLYADEGTRHLAIKNNVCAVQQHDKIHWLTLQTVGEGAKECPVDNNYTRSNNLQDNGQHVTGIHYYPKADWPAAARQIMARAGLEPGYRDIKIKKATHADPDAEKDAARKKSHLLGTKPL